MDGGRRAPPAELEQKYRDRFELLVTEVSLRNPRSLRVHERVGFEALHRYRDSMDDWVILGWDWEPGARILPGA